MSPPEGPSLPGGLPPVPMSRLVPVLALALACTPRPEAAPAPAPAGAAAPAPHVALAGCHSVPGTEDTRRIRCRTLAAVVEELAPDGLSEEVALPLLLTRELGDLGDITVAPETILLAGAPAEVLGFEAGGSTGLAGFTASRALPSGELRRVLVAGPAGDPGQAIATASLLEALLLAEGLDLPEAPAGLDFLGRTVALPEGCEPLLSAPGTTEVACPTGWTRWGTRPELLDEAAGAHLEEVMARHFEGASGRPWERQRRDCSLDGVAARCLLYTAPEGGGMLQATAAWKGVGVMVQCTVSGAGTLAPVCADLVDLGDP